jgi:hypothetical protein
MGERSWNRERFGNGRNQERKNGRLKGRGRPGWRMHLS